MRNAYFTDDIIELLLRKGADVNARSLAKSDTPLHLAAQHANMPQVESTVLCLLENGGDPHLRNKELRSPYDYTMLRDFADLSGMLQALWESRDATLNNISKFQELKERQAKLLGLRLIEAVISHRLEEVEWCLSKSLNINTRDQDGLSAVHYGVTQLTDWPQQSQILQRMLNKKDADVNVVDKMCGNTALHLAVLCEDLRRTNKMAAIVRLCIAHGARSSIQNNNNQTALDLAKERNYTDIVGILQRKNKVKILHETNIKNNKDAMVNDTRVLPPIEELNELHAVFLITDEKKRLKELTSLLRHIPDVNVKVTQDMTSFLKGDTALHIAARCNHANAVQLLLNKDADVTIANDDEDTPRDIAESLKHTEVLKILDSHGKDHDQDTKKCTIS